MQKEMLDYQSLDGELRKIKRELENDEARKSGGRYKAMKQTAEENLAKLDAKAAELKASLAALHKLGEEIAATLEEFGHAATDVENEAELNYLKKKLESQTAALANAEKEARDISSNSDGIAKNYAEILSKLPQIEAQYEKYSKEFAQRMAEAQPKIKELQKQQSELEKTLDAKTLEIYKKVRSQNIYPVYVLLQDGKRCGGCRMEISGANKSKLDQNGLVRCEHCGRIIYGEGK